MELKAIYTDWDDYFVNLAEFVSRKSKDPSTKCGAIIVGPDNEIVSTGFNGFPRGVNELPVDETKVDNRWTRPRKYGFAEHAERNAIYNAARRGIATAGCRMYLNWTPSLCNDCARAIIQAGIVEVIGSNREFPGKGKRKYYDTVNTSPILLEEAGVVVRQVNL